MLELDITDFFKTEDAYLFSASAFEMGDNAGKITWNNAKREAKNYLHWLDGENARENLRDYFGQFGAWEKEEIAGWTDGELVALLIQFISGDIREAGLDLDRFEDIDWQEYEQQAQEGRIPGKIFFIEETGRVYYFIG
jgi:hypothetical protein